MLSKHWIDILKALLIAIADHELAIEKQRQYLARLEEFEPYATFVRLDRNNNGYLTANDIFLQLTDTNADSTHNFLRENGFDDLTLEDWEYLVKYFDSDEDGVLNYTDYMQCVVTCDDPYLRAAVTQREPYGVNPDEYLAPILERELAILFIKELAYHREITTIKRDLHNAKGFTTEKAFREIDEEGVNFIDHANITTFLERNGFAPTEEELTAIIRRIDVSADASASFAEFEEAIRPVVLDSNFEHHTGGFKLGKIKKLHFLSINFLATFHFVFLILIILANPSKIKIENLQMYPIYTASSTEQNGKWMK